MYPLEIGSGKVEISSEAFAQIMISEDFGQQHLTTEICSQISKAKLAQISLHGKTE